MPELIANLRRQMAAVLLEHAAEAGADGRRDLEEELVRIAAEYEVGR